MKTIGVLALQGAFLEHTNHLKKCLAENDYGVKIEIRTVKTPEDLTQCDALIIPGGESTSMSLIAQKTGLYPFLYEFVHNSEKVVWGTCAGLIFLSAQLETSTSADVYKRQIIYISQFRKLTTVYERSIVAFLNVKIKFDSGNEGKVITSTKTHFSF